MSVSLMLLLLGGDPDVLLKSAGSRLSIIDPTPVAPVRSRYRLDSQFEAAPTLKDRALREDGRRCQVVGPRMCTRPPRTLLTAPIEN